MPIGGLDDGPALGVEQRLHPVIQLLTAGLQLSHCPTEVAGHLLQVQRLHKEKDRRHFEEEKKTGYSRDSFPNCITQ